jgi:hypothetical protein
MILDDMPFPRSHTRDGMTAAPVSKHKSATQLGRRAVLRNQQIWSRGADPDGRQASVTRCGDGEKTIAPPIST